MSFSSLGLKPEVLAGGDLMAAAQTGTGKTAGFTLPLLHILSQDQRPSAPAKRPRCLILTPTRELAAQVEESVDTYGKHLPLSSLVMFGGVGHQPADQRAEEAAWTSSSPPRAACSTTSARSTLDLSGVEILVLDEADRMLDMGFIHDIKQGARAGAEEAPEPAVLGHLLGRDPRASPTACCATRQSGSHPAQHHRRAVTQRGLSVDRRSRSASCCPPDQGKASGSRCWCSPAPSTAPTSSPNTSPSTTSAPRRSTATRARPRARVRWPTSRTASCNVLVATDIAARGLDIDQLPTWSTSSCPTCRKTTCTASAAPAAPAENQTLLRQDIELVTVAGFEPSRPLQMNGSVRAARRPEGARPAQYNARRPHAAPARHAHAGPKRHGSSSQSGAQDRRGGQGKR
jgi:ATP-dependent RNA helicase RhlE